LQAGDAAFFASHVPAEFRKPTRKRVFLHPLNDGSRYLLWSDVFEFHLSPDATVVTGHSLDGNPEAAFRTYMFGHLLALALLIQGVETIHAACVMVEDRAVAFLGDSARGKSTLAAAFLKEGATLISDDFLVLRGMEGRYWAFPGLPRIKLYERVAQHLVREGEVGTP